MPHDIDELKRRYSVSSVAGRYTKLAKEGDEHRGLCPFHKEKSPSFTVKDAKGWAHCFGCGWHGDIIQLVMDMHRGMTLPAACEIIAGAPAPDALKPAKEREETPDIYAELRPVETPEAALPSPGRPLRCWNPKRGRWTTYRPSMVFPYRSAAGALIGIVLRVDLTERTPEGDKPKKLTPTLRYVELPEGGGVHWSHMPFDKPRPLFGLDELARQGEAIWCEGEKATLAARGLLGRVVVGSPGGGKGVAHVDWSPLKGRALILWGDADAEGERAVLGYERDGVRHPGVAELAHAAGAGPIHFIAWDKAKPEGWDAADAVAEKWPGHRFWSWAKPRMVRWEPGTGRKQPAARAAVGVGRSAETAESEAAAGPPPAGRYAAPDKPALTEHPFRILGHADGVFWYQGHGLGYILGLTASQHGTAQLLQLADTSHWERFYPHRRQPFDTHAAQNALFRIAETLPVFSVEAQRGVGAWVDAGRVAIHLGDKVLVDGEAIPPSEVKSANVYQKGASMALPVDAAPASDADAKRFADLCASFGWERRLSGLLLAGWCIIAPVCGALPWRPHIWVRGPSGSGKSTVKDRIVEPMLGPLAIWRDGSTTEAALRQSVGRAARPIGIDEAETEDKLAAIRMQQVLALSRISSSGGTIGKGGKDGIAIQYTVRSCFAFFSINPSVIHYADETRIAQLALKLSHDPAQIAKFKRLAGDTAELVTPAFCAAMFARTVKNLPTLLANIQIFSAAVGSLLNSARAGQQIGAMLAGLYLCHSTREVNYDAALEWVERHDWTEHTAVESAQDEKRLLTYLASARRRVTPAKGGAAVEMTIGELILTAAGRSDTYLVDEHDAKRELGRIGIRLPDDDARHFTVANKSPELTRILAGTPWAAGWRGTLRNFEMASEAKTTRFAPGLIERGTHLEIDILTANEPQQKEAAE